VAGEKIPPHNLEAEVSCLGAALLSRDALIAVAEILRPDDFYREAHRILYEHVLSLFERNEPVDAVTLKNALSAKGDLERVGGAAFLSTLMEGVPAVANAEHYARIVSDHALLRRTILACSEGVELCFRGGAEADEVVDACQRKVFDVSRERLDRVTPLRQLINTSITAIERRAADPSAITGLATGFRDLDHLTAGLQPSDFVVLAGRPSMGKSALALNIAQTVGLTGKGVLFFSLEMSKEQLTQRLLCSEARLRSDQLRTGMIGERNWQELTQAASRLFNARIFIDDTSDLTPMQVKLRARALMRREEISLVVVDYLQLMEAGWTAGGGAESRQQAISDISRSLKSLGRELNLPVLTLSQLSRKVEDRPDHRPILSDLRESGAIEQDADVVCFLFREHVYDREKGDPAKAELIVAKQRNGPVGTVNLSWLGRFTRFENWSDEEFRGEPGEQRVEEPSEVR
jgi:replicative DNA helicase